MATTVDELTFNYTNEEGQQVRRELEKEVLSKGAWATLMYLYQDLDRRNNVYRAPKVSIVRYKKTNGVYRKQSSFNISSERQARAMMAVLERWYASEYMNKGGEPALTGQPAVGRPSAPPVDTGASVSGDAGPQVTSPSVVSSLGQPSSNDPQ